MRREDRWSPEERREARSTLHHRAKGRCELCGQGVHFTVAEAHHRQMRSQLGPDRLDNLMWLHPGCHQWIHLHPGWAYESGWLVHSWDNPSEVPVAPLRGEQ